VWEGLVAEGSVEIRREARGERRGMAYSRMYTGEEVGGEVERGSGREYVVRAKAVCSFTLRV
jgi:hypothetical protein